ncbi:MAG: DoxX family protein [Pseudomonadota bacterium]
MSTTSGQIASAERFAIWAPYSLGALRIVTGLLYMQHGMQKFFHFPPGGHATGPFSLFSLFGIGGTLELFGGALLALGLFTRSTALLLSGQMAVGYFMFHFVQGLSMPAGIFPVVNGGDLAILFCFVFLNFVFCGPGAWSLDSLVRSRTGSSG